MSHVCVGSIFIAVFFVCFFFAQPFCYFGVIGPSFGCPSVSELFPPLSPSLPPSTPLNFCGSIFVSCPDSIFVRNQQNWINLVDGVSLRQSQTEDVSEVATEVNVGTICGVASHIEIIHRSLDTSYRVLPPPSGIPPFFMLIMDDLLGRVDDRYRTALLLFGYRCRIEFDDRSVSINSYVV